MLFTASMGSPPLSRAITRKLLVTRPRCALTTT